MLADSKNLKDPERKPSASYGAGPQKDITDELDIPIQELTMSYTKTNKLITALYMVTDIIATDEPIRHKLRTLGAGIISDIHSSPANACNKIYEIMSFLEIAYAINIISQMNCNILRKEFYALNRSIKESTDKVEAINRQINLSEFFTRETSEDLPEAQTASRNRYESIGQSIGHRDLYNGQTRTRIGVQKGSTLMKALSDRMGSEARPNTLGLASRDFDILKQQRRDNIINIITIIGGNATITNIKDKVQAVPGQAGILVSMSEKTLQRELMSMTKDGVLNKVGEKRWSKYELI